MKICRRQPVDDVPTADHRSKESRAPRNRWSKHSTISRLQPVPFQVLEDVVSGNLQLVQHLLKRPAFIVRITAGHHGLAPEQTRGPCETDLRALRQPRTGE